MNTQTIALDQLIAHPLNSNVMSPALLNRLKLHIAASGLYPPIIVRPKGAKYQILDGHHRVGVLTELGKTTADCVVWQANDQQAKLLLATLNRIEGKDDPLKRSNLIASLAMEKDLASLSALLPESMDQLQGLLALQAPPAPPIEPIDPQQLPMAVYFFLLPDQKQHLEDCLADLGGTREQAMMSLVAQQVELKIRAENDVKNEANPVLRGLNRCVINT